jgi:arylsulfatase A-like enzyme
MFIRWPNKIKPLRDDATLASIIDFAPTLLKLAGSTVPPTLPGIDLLDRETMMARHTITIEAYTHDIAALAAPDTSLVTQVVIQDWSKLLLPTKVRPDKAYPSAPETVELFDLKADPFEKKNIASQQPELVKSMESQASHSSRDTR